MSLRQAIVGSERRHFFNAGAAIKSWTSGTAPTTYTNGPTHGQGTRAFFGGVLTPSGKVILVPDVSPNIGIYDPVTNTYTNGPTHGQGTNVFYGGILTPSGKVVFAPFNSANIGIFEGGSAVPANNQQTPLSPTLNKF